MVDSWDLRGHPVAEMGRGNNRKKKEKKRTLEPQVDDTECVDQWNLELISDYKEIYMHYTDTLCREGEEEGIGVAEDDGGEW